MRQYETVFIVHPDLGEEETTVLVDRYRQILEDQKSRFLKVDVWGRRTLAYMIRKQSKGVYVLFEYGATPEAVFELERNFKIDEQILRFLTVQLQPRFAPPAEGEAPGDSETESDTETAPEPAPEPAADSTSEPPAGGDEEKS